MILKSFTRLAAAFCLAASLFFACTKNDFDGAELPHLDGQYAFPLFHTTLSTNDLLPKLLNDTLSGDYMVFNQDKTVSLFYSGELAVLKATQIFNFLDTTYAVPLTDTLTKFGFKTEEALDISEADLIQGLMSVWGYNLSPDEINVRFFLPSMTKNGVEFSTTFKVPPFTFNPPFKSQKVSLAGYHLGLDADTITFRYQAWKNNGTPYTFPTGFPGLIAVIEDLKFSYLEGYWGYQLYDLSKDTIDIDINQTNLQGEVKVKNPKVSFAIANSCGFPTRVIIKELSFVGQDGKVIPLTSTVIDTGGIDWPYASLAAGEIGVSKIASFDFDETNSNIADVFNSQPVKLIYDLKGVANAHRDSTLTGFVTDSSNVQFLVKVELLLEGSIKKFGAEQTIPINFGSSVDLNENEVDDVEFKLVTENELPLTAEMQLYFLDPNDAVVDSLFTGGLTAAVRAAPVGSDGRATSTTRTETFIPMTAQRFETIKNAKSAFFKTYFTTTDNGTIPVKVLSDANVAVKMGVKLRRK